MPGKQAKIISPAQDNTYVFVERNVFRVPVQHLLDVERGDLVRIVHYPHTGTVEFIEKVKATDG